MAAKVWLSGEGPNDLGDRDKPNGQRPGVLEALLLRVAPNGWCIGGAIRWKEIRKYQAGDTSGKVIHADERNVLKLALMAKEAGCEVIAFVRDVDADKHRAAAIESGTKRAEQLFESLTIIGGVAKPAIEAWILALSGHKKTDELSRKRAGELLESDKVGVKSSNAYVAVVEMADLDALPLGCESLKEWIRRARAGLSKAIHGRDDFRS